MGSFPTADFDLNPQLPEIAFIGRSNVGKSALINATLQRKSLARTSKSPGKTRTCNIYLVDGRYYLVDLPGYGFAQVSKKERAAFRKVLEQYLTTRRALAAVVWLLDIRHNPSQDDLAIGQILADTGLPVLVAVTKSDKVRRREIQSRVQAILEWIGMAEDQCLITSSEKKQGIEDLRESIESFLVTPSRT